MGLLYADDLVSGGRNREIVAGKAKKMEKWDGNLRSRREFWKDKGDEMLS